MNEGRTRAAALAGTVALHVLVVWWLATSPEAAEQILQAMPMDFVDLPDEPPPTEPEVAEPEPAPEPEPERVERPRRRQAPTEEARTQAAPAEPAAPGSPETPVPDQPPGPRVIDFGEQNFALGGGAGWGMRASAGGSRFGLYRPGSRGGGGPSANVGAEPSARPDFSPVPRGALSREAELGAPLERRYPEEARRRQVEGAVRLMVEVRANGRVRNVAALDDPGGGLAQAAVEALRRARFRPALDRQGQPVDSRIVYTVRFVLDD
jgi:protein TonB